MKSTGLHIRAALIKTIRSFFIAQGYLEVETPVRIPAPIPEAHIESIQTNNWYLQSSPEVCMKRLLSKGFPKIFQICKCFRGNERGAKHLPEFTMLEWYRAGADYTDLMVECEALFIFIGEKLDLQDAAYSSKSLPWPRLTVADAFESYSSVSIIDAIKNDQFEEVLVEKIEPNLGQKTPLFLTDYPASMGSLARLKEGDSEVAERFELYVNGLELANGFSELIDPREQRQRFKEEQQKMESAGRQTAPLPEKFLDDLERMPHSAGIALGIDRLAMLVANTKDIADVVAFTPEDL